jgi:hypothetical protein
MAQYFTIVISMPNGNYHRPFLYLEIVFTIKKIKITRRMAVSQNTASNSTIAPICNTKNTYRWHNIYHSTSEISKIPDRR